MEKQLKDFIHLYLGCEVIGQYNDEPRKGYLTGVTNGGAECEIQFFEEDGFNVFEEPDFNTVEEVKPILRKLDSIKGWECQDLAEITGILKGDIIGTRDVKNGVEVDYLHQRETLTYSIHWDKLSAKQFHYLLSKHFWLFGDDWFDEGLIIDAETIKQ